MKNTRKNMVVCYTGINSRKNGKHSMNNFRKITRKLYSKSKCKAMKRNNSEKCPKNANNKGWINFFGAEYISPKNCNSMVKNNN